MIRKWISVEALKSEIREWWDFANEFSGDEEEDNGVIE